MKDKPTGPSKKELDELYRLPPEKFTGARDTLARRLREEGDREVAAEVKKLRRPSLAAWLVNQLGLREGDDVKALLKAGERLRRAEDAMLEGKGDADDLRGAAGDEREAIERLLAAARRLVAEDDRKVNQATFDRVGETLQAAAADDDLAELVRSGRLEKEARSATIGASRKAPTSKRGRRSRPRSSEDRAERERARATLERAERDRKLAEERRERAEKDVDEQTDRLKDARAALAEARREEKAARSASKRAEQQLRRLGSRRG